MIDWVTANEPAIRLAAFLSVFAVMAAWELAAARRALLAPKGRRWLGNLGLVVLNTVLVRVLFPTAAVGAASWAAARGLGVLAVVELPLWAQIGAALVLLDLGIYVQHVMFHAIPLLWRLHVVHHADGDFDVTTGLRFHPLEILVSMGIKVALVVLIGPPVIAIVLFEVLLATTAMFNHGNVRLPSGIDRWLRWLVVTPDMHRVHHSVEPAETGSNFGFNLPWWDRLFGTYRAQPAAGHDAMRIGVPEVEGGAPQPLLWMLLLPFAGAAAPRE